MKFPCTLMTALALAGAAAIASAAEPPSPAALRDLVPTGSRVLDGSVLAVQQALALPKGHAAGLAYVAAFVADAKASGLVAQSIERAGLRGVNVAP